MDVPFRAISLHEFLRVLISLYLVFQVAFVPHKYNWNLLCIQYLLVPVLCVIEAYLSCQICTQNHSIQRLEVWLDDGSHPFLASCVEYFYLDYLPTVKLKPYVLYISTNCFRLDRWYFEVFVKKLVDQTCLSYVAVPNYADLNDWDILFLVYSLEYLIPYVRGRRWVLLCFSRFPRYLKRCVNLSIADIGVERDVWINLLNFRWLDFKCSRFI